MPVIEFFQLSPAELSAKTVLVLAHRVGDNVGQMCGNVFAAFWRRQADSVKPCNLNVGCSGQIESVVEVQSVTCQIEDSEEFQAIA
jgi:hypothetical protein